MLVLNPNKAGKFDPEQPVVTYTSIALFGSKPDKPFKNRFDLRDLIVESSRRSGETALSYSQARKIVHRVVEPLGREPSGDEISRVLQAVKARLTVRGVLPSTTLINIERAIKSDEQARHDHPNAFAVSRRAAHAILKRQSNVSSAPPVPNQIGNSESPEGRICTASETATQPLTLRLA